MLKVVFVVLACFLVSTSGRYLAHVLPVGRACSTCTWHVHHDRVCLLVLLIFGRALRIVHFQPATSDMHAATCSGCFD